MVVVPKSFGRNHREAKAGVCKVRQSLVPGRVCILLAGPYAGRRVVFLKHIDSGVCAVGGPFGVTGVPLRRANHRYLQPTSTLLEGAEKALASVAKEIDQSLFKSGTIQTQRANRRRAVTGKENDETAFFDAEGKQAAPESKKNEKRAAVQSKVDAALKPLISKTPQMAEYLRSRFSLGKNDFPHLMNF